MNFLKRFAVVAALALASLLGSVSAQAQALSDYVENNAIDYIFRAQTWTIGATQYVGLSTAACSDSSVGTEVTGGSYARASVTRSLANWAGTQSAGSRFSTRCPCARKWASSRRSSPIWASPANTPTRV